MQQASCAVSPHVQPPSCEPPASELMDVQGPPRRRIRLQVVGSVILLLGCVAALGLLAVSVQDQKQPEKQGQLWGKPQLRELRLRTQPSQAAVASSTSTEDIAGTEAAVQEHKQYSNRKLAQFFQQVGLGPQQGFPFFLDLVLDIFDNVGYAGIVKPVSTAVDRSLAQTHLCTSSAVARANLATCNNIPGFNALAVAG